MAATFSSLNQLLLSDAEWRQKVGLTFGECRGGSLVLPICPAALQCQRASYAVNSVRAKLLN